jgi:hypothetical protein
VLRGRRVGPFAFAWSGRAPPARGTLSRAPLRCSPVRAPGRCSAPLFAAKLQHRASETPGDRATCRSRRSALTLPRATLLQPRRCARRSARRRGAARRHAQRCVLPALRACGLGLQTLRAPARRALAPSKACAGPLQPRHVCRTACRPPRPLTPVAVPPFARRRARCACALPPPATRRRALHPRTCHAVRRAVRARLATHVKTPVSH